MIHMNIIVLGCTIGSYAVFFGVVLIGESADATTYWGMAWRGRTEAVIMHSVITVRGSHDEDRADKPTQMVTYGVDLSSFEHSPFFNASPLL